MKAKQVRNDKLNKLSLGGVQTIPVTVKQAKKTQFGSLLQEAKFEDKNLPLIIFTLWKEREMSPCFRVYNTLLRKIKIKFQLCRFTINWYQQ